MIIFDTINDSSKFFYKENRLNIIFYLFFFFFKDDDVDKIEVFLKDVPDTLNSEDFQVFGRKNQPYLHYMSTTTLSHKNFYSGRYVIFIALNDNPTKPSIIRIANVYIFCKKDKF